MRRPLCLAMLGFVAAVRIITWIKPLPSPAPLAQDGQSAAVVGTVRDIVCFQDSTTGLPIRLVYIKAAALETNIGLQNNSEFYLSDNNKQSIRNKATEYRSPNQVICRLSEEDGILPEIGSRVRYQGKARHFKEASNPGEFNERAYYAGQGISMQLTDAHLTGKSAGYSSYRHFLYRIRCLAGEILESIFPGKEASIARAMLLGEKKGIDRELKNLYQEAGIAHILAISGLHISLLGMGIYRLLILRLSHKKAGFLSCLFLLSYLVMTGFSPSAVRAAIMFFLFMLAGMAGRTYDMPTALSVAAVLLLVENPAYLEDGGFRLSFMAAAGAAVVIPGFSNMGRDCRRTVCPGKRTKPVREKPALNKGGPARRIFSLVYKDDRITPTGRIKRKLQEGLHSSACISLVTLPVLLSSFYEWNILSVLLNILVIPLMGVLMGGIVLLVPAGALFRGLGVPAGSFLTLAALPVRGILFFYEYLCRISGFLPGIWHAGMPRLWQILVFYAGLILLLLLARRIPKKIGWPAAVLLCLVFTASPHGETQLTMLDVGQGDCIYIRTEDGAHYLYDAGSTSRKDTGTWQVIPFLKYQGVDRLDAIFVSHGDEDHINGLEAVFEWADKSGIPVGGLILPGAGLEGDVPVKLLEAAESHGISIYRMKAGEQFTRGKTSFICLYPEAEGFYKDRNASSLVLKLYVKGTGKDPAFTALLTGDVQEEGEQTMLKDNRALLENCDILKTAHHGSATSTTEEFLEAASPSLALISCGKNNSYGHPHREVLDRFAQKGIPVLITSGSGAVTVRVKNEKIKVEPFLDVD